ncbi:malto-oligosyltrehalose trehalohydrolase [Gulosibacter sp. 10]|uniref:malto-oligosyltrehalose trehalohydrolase n=1 Tax=Gulosibacter sp. 10 TaxID=1255570 RepID=UPI00097E87B7|nr:malto-oligosyltrehalose trehalohydrolase [Gulosibacter sp. 10]SJM51851.1 Malto-oligosyltrehalose trehalohydrolase [Gulosibacter sp. 10]
MRDSRFDVWAPFAETLQVQIDGEAHPMRRAEDGWWRPAELEFDGAEHDYAYLLGEDPTPYPDPRSRRQPHGVHGASRTFDPSAHAWSDGGWTGRRLAGASIYELHIGTFTPEGTLDSAIGRLDHLVELGVDFVEPLPVNAFNGEHGWGYDGVYWYAVHEAYGGPAAYQRFVDACHARGLGVIQDVVYNHLGPSGNYLGKYGPYLSNHHQTAWGDTVNLDGPESDEVRRYILDNVRMWLRDFHVDGLRLDAVHALVDTRATHLLEEMALEVEALSAHVGRPLALIAESDLNAPRMIAPREIGGYGLDGQWSDDFHHAAHVTLTGESSGYYADFAETAGHGLGALKKVLTGGFFHDGTLSSFRGRHHGRPLPAGTPGWRLVAAIQNHDQIGNRARGDRLSETLSTAELKLGAVLLLCSPFTPMLFQGEEWGAGTPFQFFSSHPEPELAQAVSQGRKHEFARMGWDESQVPDPQSFETFERSKLDWSEPGRDGHAELLDVYRRLLALRRQRPELTDPWLHEVAASADPERRVLVVSRGALRIVLNLSAEEHEVPLPEAGLEPLFATDGAVSVRDEAVRLPGCSAAILAPRE